MVKPVNDKLPDGTPIVKAGDVFPAKIIRKIEHNLYLVKMLNQRVHVESSLKFNTSDVYVQVRELKPRLKLKILSSYLEYMDQLITIGRRESIVLDDFNQWCLAELIKAGYSFSSRSAGEDVQKMRSLAQRLYRQHLIPLQRYVEMLVAQPEVFDAVVSLLFTERVNANFPDFRDESEGPAVYLEALHVCYLKYRLEKCASTPQVASLQDVLTMLNSFLKPRYEVDVFLFPCRETARVFLIEQDMGENQGDEIVRYQCRITGGSYAGAIVNVRLVEDKVSVTFMYYDTLLAGRLKKCETAVKELAGRYQRKLLPVRYESIIPQPILSPQEAKL